MREGRNPSNRRDVAAAPRDLLNSAPRVPKRLFWCVWLDVTENDISFTVGYIDLSAF
jgi:hypothetical protein